MIHALEPISWASLGRAAAMFGGFLVVLFLLSKWLPGRRQQGVLLRDGTRITYTLNGLAILVVVWAVVGLGTVTGVLSLTPFYRHFWPLLVVANAFAFGMTVLLYLLGRRHAEGLWRGLYYGAEVNPAWWGVDLKMFSYRPSLIGLHLLVVSFAYAQVEAHGQLSTAMLLTQIFFAIYIANYFQFEYGMLHTWDIIAERFGWMLVWGDYVLVPFFYSIAGWALVDRVQPLPAWITVTLCCTFAVGLVLFRGSNQQKHRYKSDPQAKIWGKPAETIGGKLLVSGFWGIGRKLNYTGEIMIYFAFTLPAGFDHLFPYLLPSWLTSLLLHRAWRDDRRCRAKYGDLWEAYCRRARFRMIPFVY